MEISFTTYTYFKAGQFDKPSYADALYDDLKSYHRIRMNVITPHSYNTKNVESHYVQTRKPTKGYLNIWVWRYSWIVMLWSILRFTVMEGHFTPVNIEVNLIKLQISLSPCSVLTESIPGPATDNLVQVDHRWLA